MAFPYPGIHFARTVPKPRVRASGSLGHTRRAIAYFGFDGFKSTRVCPGGT
jgi:hypothetical protein